MKPFDYINATSSIINHTLTFLINSERINRINQQNIFENNLTLKEYFSSISQSIFRNNKLNAYKNAINKNTSSLYLDHLFLAFKNTKVNDISKSIILAHIKSLKKELISQSSDFNTFLLGKINDFFDNPDEYIPIEKTKIPDGSPIGDFSCDY